MTFWDFCAPLYDLAEKVNEYAYNKMLKTVSDIVPQGASVLEAAAGTGSISVAVSQKARWVLCTDISDNMLKIARRKAANFSNITVDKRSIYELGEPDGAFDIVIAGQVLHLIDEPQKAAAELRRVAKSEVILPMSFTKNLRGTAKFGVSVYRLFGFSPKIEFTAEDYAAFLPAIGFENCEFIQLSGKIPMAVAIWRK
ncbi:MAG: class I SAM-dependent methyltransferase [Oscillospiraceae bacterium]|jgi:ubiquinone/menaquinone biosynthesis C-methylase UbiE|nr:class I SAM-dependent methyltransferase [Oscillospiraceae bacterium]